MLVLTRKRGESIRIGDNIILTIVEQDGKNVRIGITAPKTIPVHREEIYKKIENENKSAIAAGKLPSGLFEDFSGKI